MICSDAVKHEHRSDGPAELYYRQQGYMNDNASADNDGFGGNNGVGH